MGDWRYLRCEEHDPPLWSDSITPSSSNDSVLVYLLDYRRKMLDRYELFLDDYNDDVDYADVLESVELSGLHFIRQHPKCKISLTAAGIDRYTSEYKEE